MHMKKVRFESPLKSYKVFEMNENECHFPRPFIERQVNSAPNLPVYENTRVENTRIVPYNPDPVHMYEYGNLSPFPNVSKIQLQNIDNIKNRMAPTNDLDLSILDSSNQGFQSNTCRPHEFLKDYRKPLSEVNKKLSEKNIQSPPNVLNKADDFFLRRENISKLQSKDAFYSEFIKLSLDKENNPQTKKMELMNIGRYDSHSPSDKHVVANNLGVCMQLRCASCLHSPLLLNGQQHMPNFNPCQCTTNIQNYPPCSCQVQSRRHSKQICHNDTPSKPSPKMIPENSVDKKNWVVEKLEKTNRENCSAVDRLDDKAKREATITDLFKIIKLQNEQLQLLQEKVDKLISDKQETQYVTAHVALQAVEEQKMSIGVMTSFEMVRTSTIINKEVVSQNEAQIQCNRSQISIKEVVSKSQPIDINFLDGIPMKKDKVPNQIHNCDNVQEFSRNVTRDTEAVPDDKTYNEMSLYNVQVDNATTPQMSPEQSLYLDVRDYSDSDSGSDDQSNIGWTYYNKVMTHVNGMLHESDMPSSASALYRNTRQKCLQMQIDKTNVSVAKRVTFGDDPLGMQKQNFNVAQTDTSLKMNQLAAKYLKSRPIFMKSPSPKPINNAPTEMSYATRNYMEKHKLLQGPSQKPGVEIPKFLDITALKRQPKLL